MTDTHNSSNVIRSAHQRRSKQLSFSQDDPSVRSRPVARTRPCKPMKNGFLPGSIRLRRKSQDQAIKASSPATCGSGVQVSRSVKNYRPSYVFPIAPENA